MSRWDERGLSVSVEAAIVAPALVLFIGLLLTLAGVALADQHVGSAAASGARAASLERSRSAADAAASDAVYAALRQRGVECADTDVSVRTAELARGPGERGAVTVSVTCRVDFSDVLLPFIPHSITVTGERSSAVDPLRGK